MAMISGSVASTTLKLNYSKPCDIKVSWNIWKCDLIETLCNKSVWYYQCWGSLENVLLCYLVNAENIVCMMTLRSAKCQYHLAEIIQHQKSEQSRCQARWHMGYFSFSSLRNFEWSSDNNKQLFTFSCTIFFIRNPGIGSKDCYNGQENRFFQQYYPRGFNW